MLKLITPNRTLEKELMAYQQAFFRENQKHIAGSGGLDRINTNYSFQEWLKKIEEDPTNRKEGRVPAMQYALVNDENEPKIIGMLQLRLELNDYLFRFGGHIGYSIHVSERKKGYGSKLLSLGLDKARDLKMDKLLITCTKGNIGSAKVIEKNGGRLANILKDPQTKQEMKRYWITLKKSE